MAFHSEQSTSDQPPGSLEPNAQPRQQKGTEGLVNLLADLLSGGDRLGQFTASQGVAVEPSTEQAETSVDSEPSKADSNPAVASVYLNNSRLSMTPSENGAGSKQILEEDDAAALERLRTLLFRAETNQLQQYANQLEQANHRLHDRIAQLEEQLRLLEDQIYDPEHLTALISSVIREAISDRVRREPGAMANALGPEMGQAIQAQILTEPDAIVRALSPVIGATVSDYIRDGWQSILPTGLFHKTVVKTDDRKPLLVLKGTPSFTVKAAFLVHRTTGLVISEVYPFANALDANSTRILLDQIHHQVQHQNFRDTSPFISDVIDLGHSQVLLEIAEYYYITAIIQGIPPTAFRQQMREILTAIMLKHDQAIHHFTGNPASVPPPVHDLVGTLVQSSPDSILKRSRSPFSWLKPVVVLLLLVGLGGFAYALLNRPEQRLEQAVANALDASPELSVYRLNSDIQGQTVLLTGRLPNRYLRDQAAQIAQAIAPNYSVRNDIIVIDFRSQIPTRIYFGSNSTQVNPKDINEKLAPIKQFLQQNPRLQLRIIGYADSNEAANLNNSDNESEIALRRAQAVQLELEDLGIDRRRLKAISAMGTPPDVASNEPDWLHRTVVFELNSSSVE
ncbi:MAG: hypothetical protein Kow00121_34300 [Elainellaceae cyanobacterium]